MSEEYIFWAVVMVISSDRIVPLVAVETEVTLCPPAQIPASGVTAQGSCLVYLTRNHCGVRMNYTELWKVAFLQCSKRDHDWLCR